MNLLTNHVLLGCCLILYGHAGLKGQALQVREVVCCSDAFDLNHVVKQVQLPDAAVEIVHFTVCREWKPSHRVYGGSSDPPLRYFQRLFLNEVEEMPGVAYILQTSKGASGVLWRPRYRLYERTVIWGDDVFRLKQGAEIIAVGAGRVGNGAEDPNIIRVWVWAKRKVNREDAINVTKELRLELGVEALQVAVGSSPYLWEALGMPLMVPAFGVDGIDGVRRAAEQKFYYCDAADPLREVHCYSWGSEPATMNR